MVKVVMSLLFSLLLTLAAVPAWAQGAPVEYVLSFPEVDHRVMHVEVTFREVPPGPLEVRMARTSPGRYALHEFAKNLLDVEVRNGSGAVLAPDRPSLHQWTVGGHDGTVVVRYRLYGDRTDGTYLGLDATHAHMNIPATLMWARGFELRPARVRFALPEGRGWRVSSQLFPTADPAVFTAPNWHYLMDSPIEASAHTVRTFTLDGATGPTFRIALHHDGTDAEADRLARDTESIVRESLAIFGELPAFETNSYTFLADYLPWANGDGMEHRNSTVLSSSGSIRNPGQYAGLLGTIAHEFFHAWNVERIRPQSLEPFDFEDADVSGELWFGEGFTSYYDDLILRRADLVPLDSTLGSYAGVINTIALSPGRALRSAVEMSRLAPFVDAATSVDRTHWGNTFISYYTWGAGIGLALDLSLRERTDGRVTLDDYMRALWKAYGAPGQQAPGIVATPYTRDDLRRVLGEVAGSNEFADDFFRRYIEGREAPDYARLLAQAGLELRKRAAGRAWLGNVQLSFTGGASGRVQSTVPTGSPLYEAGVAQDDRLLALDGVPVTSADVVTGVLAKHTPGATIPLRFVRRSGETVETTVRLEEDPRVEIVPLASPSDAQSAFRAAWLTSRR